jgi:hypothetical protein
VFGQSLALGEERRPGDQGLGLGCSIGARPGGIALALRRRSGALGALQPLDCQALGLAASQVAPRAAAAGSGSSALT